LSESLPVSAIFFKFFYLPLLIRLAEHSVTPSCQHAFDVSLTDNPDEHVDSHVESVLASSDVYIMNGLT
jgi:hypothetical protein